MYTVAHIYGLSSAAHTGAAITSKETKLELFIIIWLLFAGTAAIIAGAKGRNPIGWFALGAIFGVFALVALAAMPAVAK